MRTSVRRIRPRAPINNTNDFYQQKEKCISEFFEDLNRSLFFFFYVGFSDTQKLNRVETKSR